MTTVQMAVDALALGSLYALVALGIAVIFGIMRLINFAHGELIMLGAYTMFALSSAPWPVLVIGAVVVPMVGALLLDQLAFRPLRDADGATLLIASFAVSYLLQNVIALAFTSTAHAVALPAVVTESFAVGGVRIAKLSVISIVGTALLVTALALYIKRSATGLRMRAAADDFTMARLVGVRANLVIAAAFAISGLLAGAVALNIVAQTGSVTPTMGVSLALIGFVATVIGGMGSIPAAAGGGFAIGVVTIVLQTQLPEGLRPYRDAFVFVLVIGVLLLRPGGLLVRAERVRL
jgi:branched-chain amino acid transport system permease protein